MKRTTSMILSVLFLLTIILQFNIPVNAAVYTGDCSQTGSNVKWTFDSATGELRISGSGYMADYSLDNSANPPWIAYANSIKNIYIEQGVKSIGQKAFKSLSAESIYIPPSIAKIGNNAFVYSEKLTEVYINDLAAWCRIYYETPNSSTWAVNHKLFLNGKQIKTLVIPDNISAIFAKTFASCIGFKSVLLCDSISYIGKMAFAYNNELEEIIIPPSVTEIDWGAFKQCDNLKSFIVLNPSCVIDQDYMFRESLIGNVKSTVIYGGKNSTAETFASKYGYTFKEIDITPIKIGTDATPFDLTVDGYSVANNYAPFSYNDKEPSKIALETYYEVFGKKAFQLWLCDSAWTGNCFGMSATATLFNDGILKLGNYTRNPINLNKSAYTEIKQNTSGTYHYFDRYHEIRKLIERYQLWINTTDWEEWVNKEIWGAEDENVISGSLNDVFKNYDNFIVVYRGPGVCHAVVIDSLREPIDIGGGWYRLYIYDPNNPYCESCNDKMHHDCYYYAQSCYIDVNIYTNHWRADFGANSSSPTVRAGYDNCDNYIAGSLIRIFDPSTLPTSFDGNAEWYYSANSANTAKICCESATIYDADQNVVFQVTDYKTTYISEKIVVNTNIATTGDDTVSSYVLELPFEEFTIEFHSEGTAQVFNAERSFGLVSDAAGCATITANNGVNIQGDNGSAVDVVILYSEDDDIFTSVNVGVENDGENLTNISLGENNELTVNCVDDNFNAAIYWEGQENQYLIKNISASDVRGKDITEYALSEGEIVPNNIADAGVSCQSTYIFDGTSKEISPNITYQGKKLVLGVDYILKGSTSATEIGIYTVTVIGQGNYYGSLEIIYEIIPALAFAGTSLTLQDDFDINFKVDAGLFDENGYSYPFVVFENNGVETTIENYLKNDNLYTFTYGNIVPSQMNDTVYATLYAYNNGILYKSATVPFTVRQYSDIILADKNYNQYHTLVKEMLNYGAMAQVYFDYNANYLANEGITGVAETEIPEITESLIINDEISSIDFYGASLVYRDKIAVRYYFTGDITGLTFTANGNTYTPVAKDGMHYVEVANILPQDLDQQITLTVTDSIGSILSVSYGPMNYIVRMYYGQSSESMKNLLRALYSYHIAAKQYTDANKEVDPDMWESGLDFPSSVSTTA